METTEFFRLDQEQWFQDFVDQEVREIREYTNPQVEFFDLEDVPFW